MHWRRGSSRRVFTPNGHSRRRGRHHVNVGRVSAMTRWCRRLMFVGIVVVVVRGGRDAPGASVHMMLMMMMMMMMLRSVIGYGGEIVGAYVGVHIALAAAEWKLSCVGLVAVCLHLLLLLLLLLLLKLSEARSLGSVHGSIGDFGASSRCGAVAVVAAVGKTRVGLVAVGSERR